MCVVLAYAGFLAAMSALLLVDHPAPIPGLPLRQNQDAETLLYLGTFVVILPLALRFGSGAADRIAAGPNGPVLRVLVALLAAGLALAVLAVKATGLFPWGDTIGVALVAALAWWVAAALAIRRALGPLPWHGLSRLAGAEAAIWGVCAVLSFAVLLCLTDLSSVSPLGAVLGAAVVTGVVAAHERLAPPLLGRRRRIAIDLVLLGLILLAVPDLLVARPEQAPGSLPISLETSIIQFHQNFLLGPANEVLAGRPMLIDTASQYGVGLHLPARRLVQAGPDRLRDTGSA